MSLFLLGFLLKGSQKLDCQLLTCLFAADNKGINYFHIKTELLLFLIMLGLRLPRFIYIDAEKKWEYQLAIKDDPLLSALADTIITGWPDNIKDVPKALWALRPYHGQHDLLTVEDGLIVRGEAIIIPPGERKKVLEQIHQGHLGTSKCQYRARQCVYWPGINKDIEQLVEACATCQRHWPQEPRQPLKPTPPPEQPWQQLGADFIMFDGSEYLVIVDYYSKMPIVWKMPKSQCNSAKTITVLKGCLQNMESLKRSNRTMDPSLQVTSLQNSQRTGTLSTVHLHQGTPGAMDKQSLQSRLSKVCLPMPSAPDRIHILLC